MRPRNETAPAAAIARSGRVILRSVLLLLCLATPAAALTPGAPWPDPDSVTDVRPVDVTIHSSDPFTPADWKRAPRRDVTAQLYLPPGASAAHPVPAVVLLHGSIGNVAERGWRYGLPLAAQGVAVLLPDTYGARADLGRTFIARALHITETMFDADAYAALDFLDYDPRIQHGHVALLGFSYGGMATQYALNETIADRFARPGERFAGFVSYYGPCIARFDDVRTTGAPLLMMYGGRDQLIDHARCAAVAADDRRGGSAVTVVDFPDAVHQWDGELAPHLVGRHLAACDYRVDRFGVIHDRRTGLAMTGPLTRGISLFLCTTAKHWPIGADPAVAAESDADLTRFLAAAFAAAP